MRVSKYFSFVCLSVVVTLIIVTLTELDRQIMYIAHVIFSLSTIVLYIVLNTKVHQMFKF